MKNTTMQPPIIALAGLLACVLYACHNKCPNVGIQNPPGYSFRIDTDNATTFDLGTIADLDAIIPLETKDECLIGAIGKVFLSDSLIVVWDKNEGNIFVFDPAGKFLRKIGNKGASPMEYVNIGDVQLSKDTIRVLDVAARKIMNYHISGKFISSRPSKYYMYTFYPVQDGCWGINMHQNEKRYNLVLLDEGLQEIKRGYFSRTEIPCMIPTNNFSLDEKNTKLIFHDPYNDTIYTVNKDSIIPFIAMDFGEGAKTNDLETEIYKGRIHNVHLYGNHLFFSFSHSSGPDKPYIVYQCYISLKERNVTVYTFHVLHDEKTIITPLPEMINISKGKLIYQIVPGEISGVSFTKETPYGIVRGDANPILVLYNLKE